MLIFRVNVDKEYIYSCEKPSKFAIPSVVEG